MLQVRIWLATLTLPCYCSCPHRADAVDCAGRIIWCPSRESAGARSIASGAACADEACWWVGWSRSVPNKPFHRLHVYMQILTRMTRYPTLLLRQQEDPLPCMAVGEGMHQCD